MNRIRTGLAIMAVWLTAIACEDASSSEHKEQGTTTQARGQEKKAEDIMTLSWFTPAGSKLPANEQDDFIRRIIEEKFLVRLNLDYMPAGADRDQMLHLMLAGKDTPDMLLINGSSAQKLALQGSLADLTPLVTEQTTPNYFKWISPRELDQYRLEGALVRIAVPYEKKSYRAYYIRNDWLEKLGLRVPDSYETMLNVMNMFAKNDPDGNGENDTYGFSASGNGRTIPFDLPQWVRHGLAGGSRVDEDGYFHDHLSDLRVEQIIEDMGAMLATGSVDPDWFLNKGFTHIDKAAFGKVGIVYGKNREFALDAYPGSLQNRSKAVSATADWIPFTPFPDQALWRSGAGANSIVFLKSLAERNPEKIKRSLDILDWLASEQGFLLTHYGVEGKHYIRDGNRIILNTSAFRSDVEEKGGFLDVYEFFTPNDPDIYGLEITDPRMTERDRRIVREIESYSWPLEVLPVMMSPPSGFNLIEFRNRLYDYHSVLLFDEKSGRNWPKYRQELMNTYGGKQLFQAYVEQIRAAGIEVNNFE